ncbi:ABC transporter permease, partial [candidate division KSB1 bacterium]
MNDKKNKPPVIAEKLFVLLTRYKKEYDYKEALREIYDINYKKKGRLLSGFWYWRQVLFSIPQFYYDLLLWSMTMFKNHLKTGFRHFKRGKMFSFINIAGLSLGFTSAILITLFVTDELSYNRFHENADLIYSVIKTDNYHNTNTRNIPVAMGHTMKEYFPEIEYYSGFHIGTTTLRNEGELFEERYTHFYPDFFKMFSFKMLQGSTESLLGSGDNIILTRSAAVRYFGSENALGKTLELGFGRFTGEFTVAGICEDVPSNSTIKFDLILSALRPESLNNWDYGVNIYVQLKKGYSPEQIEDRLPVFVKQYFAEQEARRKQNGTWNSKGKTITFSLQNIKDIYLNSPELSGSNQSSIRKSYIMSGIGILILFLACINFINLSIGRASSRTTEIGIRKLYGARINNLIRQFWSESSILISISAILSIFTAVLILPVFNSLANKNLSVSSMFSTAFIPV